MRQVQVFMRQIPYKTGIR